MSEFVTALETNQGTKKIDFQSLGNFPAGEVGYALVYESIDENGNPTSFSASLASGGGSGSSYKENIVVTSSDFVIYEPVTGTEEEEIYNLGYTYRAAVPVSGATASSYPNVTFSLGTLDAAGIEIINQFASYAGGIYIYSNGVPSGDIELLTVELGNNSSSSSGGSGGLVPQIIVTAPDGSAIVCTDGVTTLTGTAAGSITFDIPNFGTWTITASLDGETASSEVVVDAVKQYSVTLQYVMIYGISRDITLESPEWTRTDDAVGFTATASVGTVAGSSDFDNCYPWSGMVRETLDTGDVMVKIPKFYYQRYRDGNVEYIKIADKATDGFTLHPLFNHANIESDYAYVGAYKTSSDNKSVTAASPTSSATRVTFRSNAVSKGDGWSLIDIAAVSAIQMLILVEFANNNVQSVIGRGYCDSNNVALNTGSCDSVPNLTGRPSGTDGKTSVVYRGIEDFWGNIWEWVDGVNFNGGKYYVRNDQSKYADDTATDYEELSFTGATNWSQSYITQEGLDTGDNPHVILPSAAGSGSETTYECDAAWSSTGWRVFARGGYWTYGSVCGLFTALLSYDSSYPSTSIGSRLLYIPQ